MLQAFTPRKIHMGKKKCWFSYVKRLFISETKPKSEEKSKKWRWLFEVFKFRQYHPAIEAPEKSLDEATAEQRKRALAVAIATAAAAEAAVAAANAAAEVVRLTKNPHQQRMRNHHFAAVRIQSAYRGHLARKALSALKGLVKLQAVVRGELVRRRIVKTSPLLLRSNTRVHQRRVPTLVECLNGEKRNSLSQREVIKSEELRTQRSWDLSLISKEDMEALCLQKHDAFAKRERMKQYSFSHRERKNDQSLQESMRSNRFDQYLELEANHQEQKEKMKPFFSHSNPIPIDAARLAQLKLRMTQKHERVEELSSPFSQARRSFCHVKQRSIGEDGSLPSSPVFPTYMAATESARARSRSLSTPKQRLRLCETYSGEHSPYKLRLISWGSLNGEIRKSNKRNSISQHISSTFN